MVKAEVSRREPREYALTEDGRRIGALRAGTLSFVGFPSREEAREAADVAAGVLGGWFHDRWRTRQLPTVDWPIDGDAAVHAGATIVGRVLVGDDGAYGFELRIPDHLWVATGLGLAQRIRTALAERAVPG